MALKLVKARRNETEVENDLRGLGETSIFKDMRPEPILSIDGQMNSLQEAARELHIAAHPSFTDGRHFHCTLETLSHKEKALNLFAFSLLHSLQTGQKATLWEHNRLHHELHIGIREETPKLHAPSIEAPLTLSHAIQLHLTQAGFHLEGKMHGEMMHLETHQVSQLLASFAEVQAQHVSHHNARVA